MSHYSFLKFKNKQNEMVVRLFLVLGKTVVWTMRRCYESAGLPAPTNKMAARLPTTATSLLHPLMNSECCLHPLVSACNSL